jgi:mono/diheme cytochrome c family protein
VSAESQGQSQPKQAVFLLLLLGIVAALAVAAALLYQKPVPPPSEEIANDPLLAQGYTLYHQRCVSCHGERGRGDGPIAKSASPTPVGDLTDNVWKHGDRPEQVLTVIANGVKGTSMSGWSGTFRAEELRALGAYVFYLAGRDVPAHYRVVSATPGR